ncbi:MAG: hypothetical protein JST93_25625 [Acidobacteria bacterium]|nr:hypothetical protein [Acidobacteriota bacterium]
MNQSKLHFHWNRKAVQLGFRTGVSLHSHTLHSRESLDFIPRYVPKIPILRDLVAEQERRYQAREGRPIDYSRAWWTPPLSAAEAFRIEAAQIEDRLGLESFVSLSDHDSIDAPMLLHAARPAHPAPISVEWTVPYQRTFFHLGVHNLPLTAAAEWMHAMQAYTSTPRPHHLAELLEALNALPDTLIVLNHPMWDEAAIGAASHKATLDAFLRNHATRIHSLELNGLRSWRENRAVIQLGQAVSLPVVSGGDRHGCEPNAMLNLSNARSFSAFVHEIRIDKQSHVLLMPQCLEPLGLRCFEVLRDALQDMPDAAGRQSWADRVYYRLDNGDVASFSQIWRGQGPAVVRHFVALVHWFTNPGIRVLVRAALRNQEMPS